MRRRGPPVDHDAQTKKEVISEIMTELFKPEDARHEREVQTLLEENKEIIENTSVTSQLAWMDRRRVGAMILNDQVLSPTLASKFEQVTQLRRNIELDKHQVGQFMQNLLHKCKTWQEIRNSLPDCLVQMSYQLKYHDIVRTQEPEDNMKNDPKALYRYEKFMIKINTYCAMRFLY
jgi:hypothetical protein